MSHLWGNQVLDMHYQNVWKTFMKDEILSKAPCQWPDSLLKISLFIICPLWKTTYCSFYSCFSIFGPITGNNRFTMWHKFLHFDVSKSIFWIGWTLFSIFQLRTRPITLSTWIRVPAISKLFATSVSENCGLFSVKVVLNIFL